MSKLMLSLGLTLLITACATTQLPAQKSVATASSGQSQMEVSRGTQAAGQKLVCVDSYPMGSHIPQRICMTQAEAAARQKAAQEAMRNLQLQGTQQNGTSAPP